MKLPDHLSHSSVSAFDCPYQGYRRVIKKEKLDGNSLPLTLGSAFHDLVASCYLMERWDERELTGFWPTFFTERVREVKDWQTVPSIEKTKEALERGLLMIRNLFRHNGDLLRRPYRTSFSWVESEFDVVIAGFKVIGFFDLVLPCDDDSVMIVDWKTGGSLPEEDTGDDLSCSTYKDQLQLYSLVAHSLGLKVRELRLVFPRLAKHVHYLPTTEGHERQVKRVTRVLGLFDRHGRETVEDVFPTRPSKKNCLWCVFKHDCEDFEKQEKQNETDELSRLKVLRELFKIKKTAVL